MSRNYHAYDRVAAIYKGMHLLQLEPSPPSSSHR
jgi:hypothetical protein